MPTDKQLADRKNHLGASDMASVLGLNPFKSAYDLWLEKTGKVDSAADTIDMSLGRQLEQVVLNMAEPELGKMERNPEKLYRTPKDTSLPIGVNLDAELLEGKSPVEAKTTGVIRGFTTEHWGESGSDEVPDRIIVQCETQLLCTDAEICYVPALVGGRGFCMFAVYRNKELIDVITEKAVFFWQNHVIKDIPPEDCLPSLQFIKKMKRQPKSTINLIGKEDYVSKWLFAKEARKLAEKAEEDAQKSMLALLGTCEAGAFDNGVLTYLERSNKGFTKIVKPFKFRVPKFNAKELTDGKKNDMQKS